MSIDHTPALDSTLRDIKASLSPLSTLAKLADANAAAGLFDVVAEGRTPTQTDTAVPITLHATTNCKYFLFWLDKDETCLAHVKSDGTAGTVHSPAYDATFGRILVRLAVPAKSITVHFGGTSAGKALNWIAGN